MIKFMKHYALEVYTVIAMLMITLVGMCMDNLTVIQQFAVWVSFLCILHEWEEGRYPGGFLDLIQSHVLQRDLDEETKRGSRLITAVFIYVITIVPFFYADRLPMLIVATASFCIFEGIIHVVGIRIFRLPKPYTPGLVTAEVELVSGVCLILYLVNSHIGAWYDYVFGPFVFLACFVLMQRSLMAMVGNLGYRDVLANVRKRLSNR
ncbi:MAG: HXXEE domain-containing protein [Bacteroidales bacterium]|nr:HXXEE domain-containing protein [Bacteroidales bacterium]